MIHAVNLLRIYQSRLPLHYAHPLLIHLRHYLWHYRACLCSPLLGHYGPPPNSSAGQGSVEPYVACFRLPAMTHHPPTLAWLESGHFLKHRRKMYRLLHAKDLFYLSLQIHYRFIHINSSVSSGEGKAVGIIYNLMKCLTLSDSKLCGNVPFWMIHYLFEECSWALEKHLFTTSPNPVEFWWDEYLLLP